MSSNDKCCEDNFLGGLTNAGKAAVDAILLGLSYYRAYNEFQHILSLAQKEKEIADRYAAMAEGWWQYYDKSFVPVENRELAEAMSETIPAPDYEMAQGRARVAAWIKGKGLYRDASRGTTRWCTGIRQSLLAQFTGRGADAVAMTDQLGYRNERAYIEVRDDERFLHRINTVKRGRDMMADSVQLGKLAVNAYGSLSDQAWKGLAEAGYTAGYLMNRDRNPTFAARTGTSRGVTEPEYRAWTQDPIERYFPGSEGAMGPFGDAEGTLRDLGVYRY